MSSSVGRSAGASINSPAKQDTPETVTQTTVNGSSPRRSFSRKAERQPHDPTSPRNPTTYPEEIDQMLASVRKQSQEKL